MLSPVERLVRLLHLRSENRDISTDAYNAPLDKRAAELLVRVAHEMRQPLSAAVAALHISRSSPSEQVRQRASAVVDRQFARMSRLVDDLIETTCLRVGYPSLHMTDLDLRGVVQEVVEALSPQVTRKHQRLTLDVPPQAVWVHGDAMRLEQIISNVMVNGVKHTDEGGLLQLALVVRAAQAVLTVTDTGEGIDPKLLPHIFEPFTTSAHDSTSGLGIGLAVARQLVELHRGAIRAASAGPGRGSQFVVTLPLAPPRGRADATVA
jgi:signal transduction histidine kinase